MNFNPAKAFPSKHANVTHQCDFHNSPMANHHRCSVGRYAKLTDIRINLIAGKFVLLKRYDRDFWSRVGFDWLARFELEKEIVRGSIWFGLDFGLSTSFTQARFALKYMVHIIELIRNSFDFAWCVSLLERLSEIRALNYNPHSCESKIPSSSSCLFYWIVAAFWKFSTTCNYNINAHLPNWYAKTPLPVENRKAVRGSAGRTIPQTKWHSLVAQFSEEVMINLIFSSGCFPLPTLDFWQFASWLF